MFPIITMLRCHHQPSASLPLSSLSHHIYFIQLNFSNDAFKIHIISLPTLYRNHLNLPFFWYYTLFAAFFIVPLYSTKIERINSILQSERAINRVK